ncbi:MAG: hemolysin family protein [Planctomycetota bacterium]
MVTLPAASVIFSAPLSESWPLQLGAGLCCLAVASLGAHAAAALLLYSPTKLSRLRERYTEDLHSHEREYALLSWLLVPAGLAGAYPLLARSVTGLMGWPLLLLVAAAVAFLCAALPVALATHRAERLVLWALPLLRALRLAVRIPILVPLAAVSRAALRVLRITDEAPRKPEEIADEIMAAVTDSAEENALAEDERHWIENIVELKDLQVSEAMTPRTDIVAFEAQMPLMEAVQKAIDTGFSRYPVYEGKVDNVVGVFYARDALARLCNGSGREVVVCDLMRKPLFVPESMGVSDLLQQFRASKLQMAIVLDEYGGTAGLISIEDILEEIVGDISDEFDADNEEPIQVVTEGRVAEISGRARVDEVNDVLGGNIPENGQYDTVAGYVFTSLGRIPQAGETVHVGPIEVEILRANDRRIGRLRVTLLEPAPSTEQH